MRGSALRRIRGVATVGVFFLALPLQSAADVGTAQHPHFPKPPLLEPNVAFWKQVYTEHGVGDFVLHDRNRLGVLYDVVRVPETTSQARAEQLAKPEIDRVRARYRDILLHMADGVSPEDLGPEGRRVAEIWGCPCGPDNLRRAADNIRVQQGLREKVDEGLRRAQKLLPQIVTILKRHDLPTELAALPLVESTYDPVAKSKAGAVGLWQFIKSTGRQYLTVTRKRDDRRDPLRSTEAAAHLLKYNYNSLGSWPLAIVAYNHGHAGIRVASEAVGSKAIEDIVARYNGPRFGFASKNFYAEFLAALDVVHPYLTGHGKTLAAKVQRSKAQHVSLPAQPTAVTPVALPPSPASVPEIGTQPADVMDPPQEPSLVEHLPVADRDPEPAQAVTPPGDASAPAEGEHPVDPVALPGHDPHPEETLVSEAIPSASTGPSTDTPSDPAAESTPADDVPLGETAPPGAEQADTATPLAP